MQQSKYNPYYPPLCIKIDVIQAYPVMQWRTLGLFYIVIIAI